MKRRIVSVLGLLGLLASVATGQQPKMTAHFIDVGQAHATLLEFPCGAMLIDAGSDADHDSSLVAYLTKFFQRRSDLSRTLDVVLITHNHIDHTRSLRAVVEQFSVTRYFDNGFTKGSGVTNPNWLRREVREGRRAILVREITEHETESAPGHTGLTDAEIDPFNCGTVDPVVHILWGRLEENPGWPEDDFTNQNNNSLVTRIDFKQASFLFMGDLQESGIESLLTLYGGTAAGILDSDVLQVGHHGSHNGTTAELLRAVTPSVAVIPMGPWTFGQGSSAPFTTFAFGHPRRDIVNLLSAAIARPRPQPKSVMLAERGRLFHKATVRKAIYATGWDGTVRVIATTQGTLTVFREH
jgi:competence protein ComEC